MGVISQRYVNGDIKFERGQPVLYYQICIIYYYVPSIHNIYKATMQQLQLYFMKWDPIEYYFYCTLMLFLVDLKMAGRGRNM
jgi:hypothetical protein